MGNSFKIKFIIGFVFAVLILIGGCFLYSYFRKEKIKDESFKYYNNYNFTEKDISKSDLVTDTYLLNLLSLNSYNSFDESKLDELMMYYIRNITRNTSEDMKLSSNSLGFSLSKESFIKSMKELFNVDVIDIYDKFNNVNYINATSDNISFDFDYKLINNDCGYLLGIKSISKENDIITIDTYVYTFMVDSKDEEEYLKNEVINGIDTNNFVKINNLIEEKYGTYKEKVISFREVPNGDYFRYQIVSLYTK